MNKAWQFLKDYRYLTWWELVIGITLTGETESRFSSQSNGQVVSNMSLFSVYFLTFFFISLGHESITIANLHVCFHTLNSSENAICGQTFIWMNLSPVECLQDFFYGSINNSCLHKRREIEVTSWPSENW